MPNINHKNKYDCENSHSNNLWQYKRTTDYIGWDKMKDFPGNSKIGAIAFVIENKAYVGLGRSQLNGTVYLCFGHNAHEYSRDVYKFNPEEFRFIPLNTLLIDIRELHVPMLLFNYRRTGICLYCRRRIRIRCSSTLLVLLSL